MLLFQNLKAGVFGEVLLRTQGELNMVQDSGWKSYFSNDARYADVINAFGCNGEQVVTADDLQELDTQTGFIKELGFGKERIYEKKRNIRKRKSIKIRDMVRKAAFGTNFAIIGIESQAAIDYSMPLRNMSYDVGEYEKQAVRIRRQVRKCADGLKAGEYLCGFRKDSRMYPVVTFILYSGVEPWDGPTSLHEMLELQGIPEKMRRMIPDYRINLIEIRKLKDTDVFRTDVKQVFDFIRCAEDKNALAQLVEKDTYYQHMEEEAFDVVVNYANAMELVTAKDYYGKDGKVDMCTAIREMMADSREEGIRTGRAEGIRTGREEGFDEKGIQVFINAVNRGMSEADAKAIAEISDELVEAARERMKH